MENKNKRNILLGLIILLVLINLSAIVTFSYNKYHRRHAPRNHQTERNDSWRDTHERIKRYVKSELELDDNQYRNYCRLKDENFDKTRQLVRKIRGYKKALIEEVIKENPDTIVLLAYADSVGIQNKLMQIEMSRHFLVIKKTLTPEQCVKFDKMLIDMEGRDWAKKMRKFKGNDNDSSMDKGQQRRHRGQD